MIMRLREDSRWRRKAFSRRGRRVHAEDAEKGAYFGGAVISIAQIAAGRMYMDAR